MNNEYFSFEVLKTDEETGARAGILHTPHGDIETPVYMPVGTQATVKGVFPRDLKEAGSQIILSNTYHLYMRPGDEIVKKAQGAAKSRIAAKTAKENARAKNSIDGLTLIGKLAACSGKKPELNEMFIVEGDSAGGTAKQARVRQFQSILPLRGKPLNVEKKKLSQILENEEIRTMISAIGAGIDPDFKLDKINMAEALKSVE